MPDRPRPATSAEVPVEELVFTAVAGRRARMVSWLAYQQMAADVAGQIRRAHPGAVTLVGILQGGWITAQSLADLLPGSTVLSLALSARTVLPALLGWPIDVHLVRLGFHDQGNVAYLGAGGTVRHRATAPRTYRDRLSAAARDATVLVIDDNVGYGSTLRAARALVEQLGGRALTRSVESAWTLYHRSGRHDIADAADLPSLRPNLHHSIHTRLTGHLLRGDTGAYLRDGAHRAAGTLHRQMAASFDLAVSTGTWTTGQLAAMRAELAQAASWNEPPVSRPAALAAA
ncbi:phosphoribosyltransferase [Streptomyces sp. NPDC002785]|uniref:phosphoribosyltransferase n=1 Tax=Streptomyces sp. NPDC002785 TaxID=3154543 RepID=UPI0033318762